MSETQSATAPEAEAETEDRTEPEAAADTGSIPREQQMVFGDDGEIEPNGDAVETSLEAFGAEVDHSEDRGESSSRVQPDSVSMIELRPPSARRAISARCLPMSRAVNRRSVATTPPRDVCSVTKAAITAVKKRDHDKRRGRNTLKSQQRRECNPHSARWCRTRWYS